MIKLRNMMFQRRLPGRDEVFVKMRSEAKTLVKNIMGTEMNMREEDRGKV